MVDIEELKRKKLALLKLAESYKEDNKIEFFTRPNPPQSELLEAWDDGRYKVFIFSGGNRSGKTTIGCILSISNILGHYPWNGTRMRFKHNLPRKVRIIGQDWHNHIEKVVVPELKKWWPKNRKVTTKSNGIIADTNWRDEKTGSTIEIMSNGQDPETHEGWQGDLIYYDEPPKRKIRVANARGLVDREGRELFAMTLLKEAWVDQEVIKARNKDGSPDRSVYAVHADIYDNIGYGLTKEGVEQFEKTLTEDEKDARLRGIPSYMSGLVAKKFDRKRNIRERFPIPLDWMVDIGIDIHPRKEQAVLFIATSPKQERWIFREIYRHGSGTEVGEWIIRVVNHDTLRVNRIICDPLAKGDSNNDNTTFDKIDNVLGRHGYVLDTGTKDKESGIIEINNHLLGPNKEPSLFVFNDCVRTIMEFESWMYDDESQIPKKENDDMMENLYRLLLLDTVYCMPEDEEAGEYQAVSGGSRWTGY